MTFEELRAFMWETPKGQVVDSLIAVEVGIDHYEAWWQAHLDYILNSNDPQEERDVVLEFLVEVADLIDLGDAADDIDKVLGVHAND